MAEATTDKPAEAETPTPPPASDGQNQSGTAKESPDAEKERLNKEAAKKAEEEAQKQQQAQAEVIAAYEQITKDKATLTSYYDSLLKIDFQNSKHDNELIDIVHNYGWTSERGAVNSRTPNLIAVERKQKVNSSIMNYVNLFYSSAAAGKDINDSNLEKAIGDIPGGTTLAAAGKTVAGLISSGAKKVIEWAAGAGIKGMIGDSSLNGFLSPYKYLYLTEATNKTFHFPMMNNGEAYLSLQGQWSAEPQATDVINNFLTMTAAKVMDAYLNAATDIAAINQVANMQRGNIQQAFIEKAKAYNFPEDGQTVRVQFPLFNTIEKDIWKKHYRFLFLFAVRNLPYKITPYSYFPPLLYDIILPGYKRLPLCYVSNFTVQQQGVVRMMSIEDFLGGISETKKELNDREVTGTNASIPDAWLVTIEFKSLLAPSANMMLQTQNSRVDIWATGARKEGHNYKETNLRVPVNFNMS